MANAQDGGRALPRVIANGPKGKTIPVADDKIYTFEHDLRKRVASKNGPTEIFALASSPVLDFLIPSNGKSDYVRDLLIVSVFKDGGKVQWLKDYGKDRRTWKINAEQTNEVRAFCRKHGFDKFLPLPAERIVAGKEEVVLGGTAYIYLHLDAKLCHRLCMNNTPFAGEGGYPPGDPIWKYTEIVDFFQKLKDASGGTKK